MRFALVDHGRVVGKEGDDRVDVAAGIELEVAADEVGGGGHETRVRPPLTGGSRSGCRVDPPAGGGSCRYSSEAQIPVAGVRSVLAAPDATQAARTRPPDSRTPPCRSAPAR